MLVTIITICYNNENDVENTIKSVIEQTYSFIEYIIVDGASTDGSILKVQEYSSFVSIIISEPDNGIYDAINKGIRNATGDIIGLIHAGDELHDKDVIKRVVSAFKINHVDAIYGHSKIYSSDGKKIIRINKSPNYKHKLFRIGWFPSHQSFYANRELFEKYGYYNLKYKIAADYELLFRFLYVNKIKAQMLDAYIVKFKLGGTSTKSIRNIIIQNKECIQAWKDNGLRIPFYTILLKVSRKIKQMILSKLL